MVKENFSNINPFSKKLKEIPGIFGIRLANERFYDVITSDGNVEIRSYKSLVMASIAVRGNLVNARKEASILLPLVSPIFYEPKLSGWAISCILPSQNLQQVALFSKNKRIKLLTFPARVNACLNYSGVNSQEKIKKYSIALMDWIEKNHLYDSIGVIQTAEYDGPSTIPFLRKNEVMIEVNGI